MSYLGNLMAEQEADDYLMSLGDGERRELMEDVWDKPEKRKVGRPRKSEEEKKQRRKEYNAKYWANNKAKISKTRKEKYRESPEKVIDRNKRWFSENRDRWNAYQREYRKRKKAELDKSNKA